MDVSVIHLAAPTYVQAVRTVVVGGAAGVQVDAYKKVAVRETQPQRLYLYSVSQETIEPPCKPAVSKTSTLPMAAEAARAERCLHD